MGASRACRACLPLLAVVAAWVPAAGAFSSCPPVFARGPLAAARRTRCGGPASGVLGLCADVTVSLPTPLGIVFEEVEPGANKGLIVADLVRSPRACARHSLSRRAREPAHVHSSIWCISLWGIFARWRAFMQLTRTVCMYD